MYVGSTPANTIKPTLNTYLNMIRNLESTFSQRFGPWPRHDPSHSPHYMQLHWLQLLQQDLEDLFGSTSAAHFRRALGTVAQLGMIVGTLLTVPYMCNAGQLKHVPEPT